MANIIHIETSTEVCSAALTSEGAILEHYEHFEGQNHATLLSGFIKGCLDHLNRHDMKLDAVAVSLGPGVTRRLRIGLSEAKGLAYALDVPLIGIDTLQLMACSVMFSQPEVSESVMFAPMIDARRMEVYTGVYDLALQPLSAPAPLILDSESYKEWLDKGEVLFFGNGSDKARDVITHPNARFIADVKPLAVDMLALAERAWRNGEFIDRAYSVPTYLKEFQATKPKKLF